MKSWKHNNYWRKTFLTYLSVSEKTWPWWKCCVYVSYNIQQYSTKLQMWKLKKKSWNAHQVQLFFFFYKHPELLSPISCEIGSDQVFLSQLSSVLVSLSSAWVWVCALDEFSSALFLWEIFFLRFSTGKMRWTCLTLTVQPCEQHQSCAVRLWSIIKR